MEPAKEICDNINFSNNHEETSFELLNAYTEKLANKWEGLLIFQIITKVGNAYDDNLMRDAKSYILSVIRPKRGNFSRNILTVVEYIGGGPFPVDIYSHIDKIARLKKVQKADFITEVQGIMSGALTKNVIEDLYTMSKSES